MPTRVRPLFLVPSLMTERQETSAVVADRSSGLTNTERVISETVTAVNDLLLGLEPLIVEANLAGYEMVHVAASAGPGNVPAFLVDVATLLINSADQSWDDMVGLSTNWNDTSLAVALHFEPRLAMRSEVDGSSSLASSYAVPVTVPPSWEGTLSANTGGWVIVTADDGAMLPDDLAAVPGKARSPGSPANDLLNAIRDSARSRWESHGRTPTQLQNCAIAALFDPVTWLVAATGLGVEALRDSVERLVWNAASGWQPSYDELATWSLSSLLGRSMGTSAGDSRLAVLADGLRNDLIRRELGDPNLIAAASRHESTLSDRYHAVLDSFDRFGRRPWPQDLFLLLELGMISLVQRVSDEEPLPVAIRREWTEPALTGRYDRSHATTMVTAAELGTESGAHAVHATVAPESDVVLLNQAGDHIAGYWQQRLDAGPGNHVVFKTWIFEGTRDHDSAGMVYDTFFAAGAETGTGPCVFTATGSSMQLDLDWFGTSYTLYQRPDTGVVLANSGTTTSPPAVPSVRPYLSDSEIGAINETVRPLVEAAERWVLHPAEVALLGGIVDRLATDLETIAGASGQTLVQARAALCVNFTAAFAYFGGNGRSNHHVLARTYILVSLLAKLGNNSPLDPWFGGPPPNYLYALAAVQANQGCDAVTEHLGLDGTEIDSLNTDNEYRWKFRSNYGVGDAWVLDKVKSASLGPIVSGATSWLFGKSKYVLSKVDDIEFGVAPDPQFDLIEGEFQKVSPYPDNDWTNGQSEFYDGVLLGLGISAAAGMNVTWETEWSTVNTMAEPWSPDDFAGPFWTFGISWGSTILGTEIVQETMANWLRSQLGLGGPIRSSGDYSYTQFVTDNKSDVWAIQLGFTNSFGLHVEVAIGGTGGYLWRRGQPINTAQLAAPPDPLVPLNTTSYVAFEVGRSDLTSEGEAALRSTAAYYLHALASPSTNLRVDGHASAGDARELYNMTLSERRAHNVVRYLRSYLGPLYAVTPQRTIVHGLGEEQSNEEGGAPESWRRVDLIINGALVLRMDAL